MMKGLLAILWCLMVAGYGLPTGCRPVAHRIPVSVIYSGVHCGAGQQAFRATWIGHPDGVAQQGAVTGIQWDPEKEGVLWLEMGVKPTGGYALELDDPEATVTGGAAVVTVRWRTPPPDGFVTQALTAPCLVLKLPKVDLEAIHIQDQDGALRAKVQVPGDG
jgi:hypothetical protein